MKVSFTLVSQNPKTGPIPNTITEKSSCSPRCPHIGTCYAHGGPLFGAWTALENNGYHPASPSHRRIIPRTWEEMCDEVSRLHRGQIWRHNTAGDLPGEGDYIDTDKLNLLVQANKKARAMGFTYTHKHVGFDLEGLLNARAIYKANQNGFRISLSADSLKEADDLADMDIAPVVVVIPSDAPDKMLTPKGRKVIACPAEKKDDRGNPAITCKDCKLCAKPRKVIVAFHAHGTYVKETNRKLRQLSVVQE